MDQTQPTRQRPEVQPSKHLPWLSMVLATLTFILTGLIVYLTYQNILLKQQIFTLEDQQNQQQFLQTQISSTPTDQFQQESGFEDLNKPAPAESYTEDTQIPGQKKYVSSKLGVSFLYFNKDYQKGIKIKELGNKIYLYDEVGGFEDGQYIEVFTKEKQQTLTQTLKNQFLTGYSADNCEVVDEQVLTSKSNSKLKNYTNANIQVKGEYADIEELLQKRQLCPSYTQSNGISFFIMDPNHPDKFAFLSIGQYAIIADPDQELTWQDTLQFLD